MPTTNIEYQLQGRRRDIGKFWEPFSLERAQQTINGHYERQYSYPTAVAAKKAFDEFVNVEGSLPSLMVRIAEGLPKLTEVFEIRIVETREIRILDVRAIEEDQ